MYCSKCGTQNDDNAFRCVKCGVVIQSIEPSMTAPDQGVSSHLLPAIIVTLLCCLPFGIVAIVYAAKVKGRLNAGDYSGAIKASDRAKTWCWVALCSGVIYLIIGILAAIAIPQFNAYRTRSYNAAAQTDLRNAMTAQEGYYVDNEKYTATLDNLVGEYGLLMSQDVTLEIIYADDSNYHMRCFHINGSELYQVEGPGGTIETEYRE